MGPTVCELEGPMPILKSSKRLVFTVDLFWRKMRWLGSFGVAVTCISALTWLYFEASALTFDITQ
jgi:hypothetical protein